MYPSYVNNLKEKYQKNIVTMCGICGVIQKAPSEHVLIKMVKAIKHRGPDAQNVKVFLDNDCGFGHARLSIIDLSEAANQPMCYHQFVIVFNGEIYNFKEIKRELEALGHVFKLESDTEVILHAFEQWGDECVSKFIGMFAIAILDKEKNELTLFRDRTGIKPLYYYEKNNEFMFASELKSFYYHPHFERKLNQESVALYFKYHHIPAPYAIYENTWKLMPGHILKYYINMRQIEIKQYWNVLDYYSKPVSDITYEDAKEQLEILLKSAFKYRMVSDVPVGVFLSGGYDSSGVTALLQSDMTDKLKTFTIGFSSGKNEIPEARKIANYLGTDHTDYICTPDDAKKIIPEIPFCYDEPYDDSSSIPTILVSRLAKQNVTVALSADGGDETFAGYLKYGKLQRVKSIIDNTKKINSDYLEKTSLFLCKGINQFSNLREKGEAFSRTFSMPSYYRYSMSLESSGNMMKSLFNKISRMDYPPYMFLLDERKFNDPLSIDMAMDYLNYLPNDILTKVDRATMSVSLEGREPLLDHRIIEFVAPLPSSYKLYKGKSKCIYKDIVHKYIPSKLMDRPKSGFSVPILEWLKGDLRYLLDENINEKMEPEFFNIPYVLNMKKLFLANKLGHEERLMWRILEFQLWYNKNVKS